MYIDIKNENYGYSVATYGDFVAIGNPGLVRYNSDTSSVTWSGSIDIFKYNYNLDQHEHVGTLYKDSVVQEVVLAEETGSILGDPLSTEPSGSDIATQNQYIQIDRDRYTYMREDGYGVSVDIHNKILVVGCPYYLQEVETSASFEVQITGSSIDIFNLSAYDVDSYNNISSSNVYITSLSNPEEPLTGSFGYAVSINDGWIAVGSPYVSGSEGIVYLYKNDSSGSNLSWSFQQKIIPNDTTKGLLFGSSLELNKVTGSMSGSLIVGIGNISGSKAFLFEYISGSWTQTYIFTPYNSSNPLTFGGYDVYSETFPTSSRYGNAVSMYNNTVVIGSSQDRVVQEYTSSGLYEQGAVYVYERCVGLSPIYYNLVLKTYGNENILKNNRLGYSVGVHQDKIIAGSPRINVLSPCYIQNTIEQLHYCSPTLDNTLTGQSMYLLRNTSSNDWELANIYQRKKRYLSPYRLYGYSVDIADKSMVIGSPMLLSTSDREVNLSTTESFGTTLDDVCGKAYIYNINNYREEFHVGNVFYRNGKIILMTSGSVFDGLLFNPISENSYEYQIDFKGEHTIYEKQIVCTVEPGEFNVSTNPSAITREISTWDINGNGYFDFQDVDVLLSYMQYKNTKLYGNAGISTNWSSSIVITDDEKSLLAYYKETYDTSHTDTLISESISRFETVDIEMQLDLDLNQDNRIDLNDLNIMWKYFSNRLTQANYITYITPACSRKHFNEIIDHMESKTQHKSIPNIKSEFFDYERLSEVDKTGSFLVPMVTTIGLYSDLELVAVAKLGSPIRITPKFPMNFVIKLDF